MAIINVRKNNSCLSSVYYLEFRLGHGSVLQSFKVFLDNDCEWTEKAGKYLAEYPSTGKKSFSTIEEAKAACIKLELNGIIIYYKNWQGITFPKVALHNIKAGYLKFKFLECGGITYSDKHKSYSLRKGRTPETPKTPSLETSWLRPNVKKYCENGETNHLHPMCLSRAILKNTGGPPISNDKRICKILE